MSMKADLRYLEVTVEFVWGCGEVVCFVIFVSTPNAVISQYLLYIERGEANSGISTRHQTSSPLSIISGEKSLKKLPIRHETNYGLYGSYDTCHMGFLECS